MVGHGGSSAGSYLTDPTSPVPHRPYIPHPLPLCYTYPHLKVSQCINCCVEHFKRVKSIRLVICQYIFCSEENKEIQNKSLCKSAVAAGEHTHIALQTAKHTPRQETHTRHEATFCRDWSIMSPAYPWVSVLPWQPPWQQRVQGHPVLSLGWPWDDLTDQTLPAKILENCTPAQQVTFLFAFF